MYIKSISLNNFRNYEKLKIDFSKDVNIIYGYNAQGKTNILEAIYLCSTGRSHRTQKDQDLIKRGTNEYIVNIDVEKENLNKNIEIRYKIDEKKKLRVNEIPLKKLAELIGVLNTVMFSPEDLQIIKEGPSERRRFIDITLSQIKPSYFYDLQQYMKVLFQRNNLLKEIQYKKNLIDTLEVWNINLVDIGSRIIKARYDFVKRLNVQVEEMHNVLSNNKEKLSINYTPSVLTKNYESLEEIKSAFYKTLETVEKKELIKAATLCGPQRDDYDIRINDASLKLYGSQGQQRTSVLSFKLSEVEIMRLETGEYPILLLDDVMSELDNKRQEYLMGNLSNIQTFITSTDKSFVNGRENLRKSFYYVEKGNIFKE